VVLDFEQIPRRSREHLAYLRMAVVEPFCELLQRLSGGRRRTRVNRVLSGWHEPGERGAEILY